MRALVWGLLVVRVCALLWLGWFACHQAVLGDEQQKVHRLGVKPEDMEEARKAVRRAQDFAPQK